ncbi:MAG TPA: hypothetical protein VGS58_21870, partial [Candidatus Sulfopaludibacter sp.]|nr:hypothetical protein [Candidatus Sulfopaludibacter sp.]
MLIPSARSILLCFVFLNAVSAQSTLTLSPGSATPGGSATLNLSLSSPAGGAPAALQWTFSYPAANVANINVVPGASATAAGKSIACTAGAAAYTCIAYGINSKVIANGVVAVVTAGLTSTAGTTPVGVSNAVGASLAGKGVTVTASGGTIN